MSETNLIEEREQRLELMQDAGARQAEFKICRRARFTPAIERAPWDYVDFCRLCNEEVVFDARDSLGRPHICIPCAQVLRSKGMRELNAIEHVSVDESELNDQEQLARMAVSISQHNHNETARKDILPPSFNPQRGLGAHISSNPKDQLRRSKY